MLGWSIIRSRDVLVTRGGSPLYGKSRICIISSAFSSFTISQLSWGISLRVGPRAAWYCFHRTPSILGFVSGIGANWNSGSWMHGLRQITLVAIDRDSAAHACKRVLREDLRCFGLFLWVLLPFYVPMPSLLFLGEVCMRMSGSFQRYIELLNRTHCGDC